MIFEWQALTEPTPEMIAHGFTEVPPGLIHTDRELPWWTHHPRPHSALAELGRLGNRELIIGMAQLINRIQPAKTKDAAEGIRAFRLALARSRRP